MITINPPSSDEVKYWREFARLTQEEAATAIGVTRVQWCNYESGRSVMPVANYILFMLVIGEIEMEPLPVGQYTTFKSTKTVCPIQFYTFKWRSPNPLEPDYGEPLA